MHISDIPMRILDSTDASKKTNWMNEHMTKKRITNKIHRALTDSKSLNYTP